MSIAHLRTIYFVLYNWTYYYYYYHHHHHHHHHYLFLITIIRVSN